LEGWGEVEEDGPSSVACRILAPFWEAIGGSWWFQWLVEEEGVDDLNTLMGGVAEFFLS
jgi:hypothetical protein